MNRIVTTIACLTLLHSSSYSQTATQLLTELQRCINQSVDLTPVTSKISKLPPSERKQLIHYVERAWPKVQQSYFADLKKAIKVAQTQHNSSASHARIDQLRAQFLTAYRLPESEMPSAIKSQSVPALKELQSRMLPSADSIAKAGGPSLKLAHSRAHSLAKFRDELLRIDSSRIPPNSVDSLQLSEQKIALDSSEIHRKASLVHAQNRKIAAQHRLPHDVVKGIEECNKWRILAGLHACVIDPKLCLAAYDEAKDMSQLGFFSHESPVEGKKTPWDRAMRFSTTAAAENIFKGSTSYAVANRRWFHSPSHHKVMFHESFRRIGLARYGEHWVQMFGR